MTNLHVSTVLVVDIKQKSFLNTCKVFVVNLPLLFDEEYIVSKTLSLCHFDDNNCLKPWFRTMTMSCPERAGEGTQETKKNRTQR